MYKCLTCAVTPFRLILLHKVVVAITDQSLVLFKNKLRNILKD